MSSDNPHNQSEDEKQSELGLRRHQSPQELDPDEEQFAIYECPECENVLLTVRPPDEAIKCHGMAMTRVTEWEIDIQPPELRQVLLDAFGLPKVGLDICLCVIGEGPLSPSEIADILDYDRSTISSYLNELVDIGLLEKSQLNREGGGYVNVYHSIELDSMRRETLIGFYVWAGKAAALIEEANVTKEEYLNEDYSDGLQEVFWEEFRDET